MEAIEFAIGLNDRGGVRASKAKGYVTHDSDDGMLLDIEVMIRVNTPFSEDSEIEMVDRQDIRHEDSTWIGNEFGYQRHDFY